MEPQQKILIVEDEEPLLNVLTDEFVERGFEVIGAQDGAEGLSRALREEPDIILLDVIMPVMDGITMLEWLRKENEWGETVPIILLSNLTPSDDDIESIERLRREGGRSNLRYVQKSEWMLSDVVEAVQEELALR